MILDYGSFASASTAIHALQGLSLLGLGAAEAYAVDNPGRRAPVAAALLMIACAAASVLAIFAMPGGWSLDQLSVALNVRRGFYLFIAFSCLYCSAGLSRLTQEALGRAGGAWRNMSLLFISCAAGLYFLLPWRVNESVWRETLALHAAIGVTLLLAVVSAAAYIMTGRRRLRIAWAVLLLAAGLQLVTYRETPAAYEMRLVTIQSENQGAAPAAAKNATHPHKERTRR